jgi:hypothetical protein
MRSLADGFFALSILAEMISHASCTGWDAWLDWHFLDLPAPGATARYCFRQIVTANLSPSFLRSARCWSTRIASGE